MKRFGHGPYLIRQVGAGPITLPASTIPSSPSMPSIDCGFRVFDGQRALTTVGPTSSIDNDIAVRLDLPIVDCYEVSGVRADSRRTSTWPRSSYRASMLRPRGASRAWPASGRPTSLRGPGPGLRAGLHHGAQGPDRERDPGKMRRPP